MLSLKMLSLKMIMCNLKLDEKRMVLQEMKQNTDICDLYLLQEQMHPTTAIYQKIKEELTARMPLRFVQEMSRLQVTHFLHMGTAIELSHPMFGKKPFRTFSNHFNSLGLTQQGVGRLCLETYRMMTYDFKDKKFNVDIFELSNFLSACCDEDEEDSEFIVKLMQAVFDFSVHWEQWEKMNVKP